MFMSQSQNHPEHTLRVPNVEFFNVCVVGTSRLNAVMSHNYVNAQLRTGHEGPKGE
jgi:hypothetical protein